MTKKNLIKKYTKRLKAIINPDNSNWKDFGFDIPPKGYDTVEAWLEINGEFDEGDQTEIRLCYEFLEDIEKLNL